MPQVQRVHLINETAHKQFVALVNQTRDRLETLYGSSEEPGTMRDKKSAIIEDMKQQYQQLKVGWEDYAGYDRWFSKPINNAQIAAVTTYRDYVPAFQALLAKNNHDMRAFYQAVAKLGELPKQQRSLAIQELMPADNPL